MREKYRNVHNLNILLKVAYWRRHLIIEWEFFMVNRVNCKWRKQKDNTSYLMLLLISAVQRYGLPPKTDSSSLPQL